MSLQVLANTLQNQGRGNDSMLVHMTPGEVAGLQSLALSKGGSLTINPVTGLPEAGFLDTMLSIGGGFLGGMVGGPLGAAIGSGLGSYIGGASPQQALMSGVLGYGLGGLGEGIERLGSDAASEAVREAAQRSVNEAAQNEIARAIQPSLGSDIFKSVPEPLFPLPEDAYKTALDTYYQPPPTSISMTPSDAVNLSDYGLGYNLPAPAATGTTANLAYSGTPDISVPAMPSRLDNFTTGLGKVAESPLDFAKNNWKYLGAAGLGAAGKFGGLEQKPLQAPQLVPTSQLRPYSFTPYNQLTRANPYYTPLFANGGAVPYPAGGVGYPQQNVLDKTDFYAQSTANPTPTAVVGAAPKTDYDARITQQGDEFKAAGGGEIRGFKSGGPYGSAGPIYGIDGPIYGVNSSKVGPYQNTDAYSGISQQMNKMSPAKLKILAENATDPIVMAAAQDELYSRANAAPSGYIDKPTIQAAEGGTIKMADGGLPGFWGLLAQSGLFGPVENKPVQYSYDPKYQRYTQLAQGGIASLGEYAAGGKLLEGPGDGMSDSIPAVIKGPKPQRAALAQGEFVISADVVSGLGNGSTDAGAKRLYAMMDRVRKARTGTKKQGRQINPEKFMPA